MWCGRNRRRSGERQDGDTAVPSVMRPAAPWGLILRAEGDPYEPRPEQSGGHRTGDLTATITAAGFIKARTRSPRRRCP